MTNPNAPIEVAEHAAKNGIDLTEYYGVVAQLRTYPFINPEPPFAEDVRARLRFGHDIGQAVVEARGVALSQLAEPPEA